MGRPRPREKESCRPIPIIYNSCACTFVCNLEGRGLECNMTKMFNEKMTGEIKARNEWRENGGNKPKNRVKTDRRKEHEEGSSAWKVG